MSHVQRAQPPVTAHRWQQRGPSPPDCQARLGAVKTPREARPRLRRADGLDRAFVEPGRATVDGPANPRPNRVGWRPSEHEVVTNPRTR